MQIAQKFKKKTYKKHPVQEESYHLHNNFFFLSFWLKKPNVNVMNFIIIYYR